MLIYHCVGHIVSKFSCGVRQGDVLGPYTCLSSTLYSNESR